MVRPLTIAFLENQLAFRGTQGTLWSLAHFNENILGNKSIIISRKSAHYRDEDTTNESIEFFTTRFPDTFFIEDMNDVETFLRNRNVDAVYIPISGAPPSLSDVPKTVPSLVHCVFSAAAPAGTVQTAISPLIARGRCPVLTNVIHVDFAVTGDLRAELGIPEDSIVFGRYGGAGTFNIPFAKEVVLRVAAENPRTFFLFMNTHSFGPPLPNVIFLRGTRDIALKTRFIQTCDAMLHARVDGETFGMACGEFAVLGKPVITSCYGSTAHIDHYLKAAAILYHDSTSLYDCLTHFQKGHTVRDTAYDTCLPEAVIYDFDRLIQTAIAEFKEKK